MIFTEEFLLEATFKNPENLNRHYHDHVLQPGEIFDPENPKFPYMTKEEYARKAEELSLKAVGLSSDFKAQYIGFVIKHPKSNRLEKFKTTSSIYDDESIAKQIRHLPGTFSDVVLYVDDDIHGCEIISYMVGRPGKIFREKQKMVGELPENLLNIEDALKELNIAK